MGLRGLTGAPHLDSGYADLDAAECVPAEGAQGIFSSRESGVHQAKEQQQTADAAAVLQETQPEHERLERSVQIVFQVGRKVGWPASLDIGPISIVTASFDLVNWWFIFY